MNLSARSKEVISDVRKATVHINKWINAENLPYIMIFLAGIVYLLIVICNHYFFRTYCYDYGAYNFAFYDYAHFRISESPIYQIPHMSFLQDHVSFTFFLFIPLYWTLGLITGTYTLLIIQTVIILYGGWALYKLIRFKTDHYFLSLLALGQYFFLVGRWTSFVGDCNLAIIASSMIPVFLYYFEKEYKWAAFFVFVFILLTREDMALWLIFIGIFLFISHAKKSQRYTALGIIVFSLAYFVVVFKVLIPLLETPYKTYSLFNYSALGDNPYEALIFIIRHPFNALKLLFINTTGNPIYNHIKSNFYLYYMLCGGFLLFYRPKYVLLFVPIIAKKMWNDGPINWSMEWYYSIEFVSVLPIAVFLIISEIRKTRVRNIVVAAICVFTLVSTVYYMDGSHRRMDWWGDRKYAFYKRTMYKADFDVKKVYRFLKVIPSDAKVSASGNIVPHLAFRSKIYNFPRIEDADYLVFLLTDASYPLTKEQFDNEVLKYRNDQGWKEIVKDYPLLILKKN